MRVTGEKHNGKEQRRLVFAPGPGCLAGRLPLYLLDSEGLQESQSADVFPHLLLWPWPVVSLTP